MDQDKGRLDDKVKGAVVVDLAAARERRDNAGNTTMKFTDPVSQKFFGTLLLAAIALFVVYRIARR